MNSRLVKYRKKANHYLIELNHTKRQIRDEKQALIKARKHQEDVEEAHKIITQVAQEVQQIAHKSVSDIVTECLRSIFPDPYEFKIDFRRSRGRTEARLLFMKSEHEVDPSLAAGGSCRAVAGFALRLSSILLARPQPRKILVLDEPFAQLSETNASRVGRMLERLSQEFGIQIILVTHSRELEVGKVVRIS